MGVLTRFLRIIFLTLAVLMGLCCIALLPFGGWVKIGMAIALFLALAIEQVRHAAEKDDDDHKPGPPSGGDLAREGA